MFEDFSPVQHQTTTSSFTFLLTSEKHTFLYFQLDLDEVKIMSPIDHPFFSYLIDFCVCDLLSHM